jgi:hypothetical protein
MKPGSSVRSTGLTLFCLPIPVVSDAFAPQPVRAQAAFAPSITSKPAHPMPGRSSTAFIASGATFRYRLAAAEYTGSEDYAGALARGWRTFQANALYGSKVRTSTSYSWTVATFVSPPPSPAAKPANPSNTASPSFSFGGARVRSDLNQDDRLVRADRVC